MEEISVYDDAVFKLMEELYRLNHRKWKKRVIKCIEKGESKNYNELKAQLSEVPDLLAYRCIQELVKGGVLKRTQEDKRISYSLETERSYIQEILKDL